MLTIRREQLETIEEGRRRRVLDAIVDRSLESPGGLRGRPARAESREVLLDLASRALDQASVFGFFGKAIQEDFAVACLRHGELFEDNLESHLTAADIAGPVRTEEERFALLLEMHRDGLGAAPRERPPRDPASQPFSLTDGAGSTDGAPE